MASFGFRLFTFNVHDGHKHKQLDLIKPQDSAKTARDLFVEGLRGLTGTTRPGLLRYPDRGAGDPIDDGPDLGGKSAEKNRPCIRVETVIATTERVEVSVRYGREGDFDFAVHSDGRPDTDLQGAATTRLFTVLIYFPSAGNTGVLIAETRARGQVGESLLRLLSVVQCEKAMAVKDPGEPPRWLRWSCKFMTDSSRLEEVLRSGEEPALTLVRHGANSSGQRETQGLTLTQNGVKFGQRQKLQQVVLGWMRRDASATSRRKAAAELSAFVDANVGGVEFTDGEVRFVENGKTQTITPSNVERLLIYPTGSARLSADALAKQAVPRLRRMTDLAKIPIEYGVDGETGAD